MINELNIDNTINKENLKKVYNYLNTIFSKTVHIKQFKNDYTITLLNSNINTESTKNTEQNFSLDTPYLNYFIDDFYTSKEHELEFYSYRNSILKLVE